MRGCDDTPVFTAMNQSTDIYKMTKEIAAKIPTNVY